MKECLSYDDVLLVPQYSDIVSRDDVDISSRLGEMTLTLPLIASPMDSISEHRMGASMSNYGGASVIHRYNTIEQQVQQIQIARNLSNNLNPLIGAAIGITGDYIERAMALKEAHVSFVCLDVAHGHHIVMKEALQALRKKFDSYLHLMAGNIATLKGINDLAEWGADSARCNIGGGSICSTRVQTGHGMPGFQTILECSRSLKDIQIIADGGIKNSGDIVKALAAGADIVMCGSLFAGTDETPGQIFEEADGTHWKTYRGMASKEAQLRWRGRYSSFEGVSARVPYRGSIEPILQDLERGIRSGFSYSGARTLQELQQKAMFVKQTSSGLSESHTHITSRQW
jgi:IMP dehydrogenase